MDYVAAFSLACGVIQVLDFSLCLLSKSKEIQEKGSLVENDNLEYLTHHINDLNLEVRTIYGLRDVMRLNSWQLDTKSIVSKCQQVDDQLNAICAGFLETYDDEQYDLYGLGHRSASYS